MAMIPAGPIHPFWIESLETGFDSGFEGTGIYRISLIAGNIHYDRIPEEEIYEWPKAQAPIECEPDTGPKAEHPPAGNSDPG